MPAYAVALPGGAGLAASRADAALTGSVSRAERAIMALIGALGAWLALRDGKRATPFQHVQSARLRSYRARTHANPRHRHPDPRRRRRGPVRGAACQEGAARARRHHRGEGPARQMRLHAHGAGRLQRRARADRLGRAAFHGHRSRAAAGSTSRSWRGCWSAPRRCASANWKTRSAASSTAIPTAPCIRRRSPGRPSTAPCTRAISPASRSSTGWPSRSGGATCGGWRITARSI